MTIAIIRGAPCLAETCVPVMNLTDYLKGGSTVDEFLDDFPSVKREEVVAFLVEHHDSVTAPDSAGGP